MTSIYVLVLEHGKYYVGKSNDVDSRIKQHFEGEPFISGHRPADRNLRNAGTKDKGSAWTRLHKPVRVLEIISSCDNFDEDKYTKMYMSIHGIENVRGGSYCQIYLDESAKDFIRKEIMTSNDSCFRCGSKGHYIEECLDQKSVDSENDDDINETIGEVYNDSSMKLKHRKNYGTNYRQRPRCHRCGRNNHSRKDCYAKTNVHGERISLSHCYRCGRPDHWSSSCKETQDIDGINIGNNDQCIII